MTGLYSWMHIKLEILKKITPSFGEAAIPVDLFDNNIQSVFALKIKKQFANGLLLVFSIQAQQKQLKKNFR